MVSQIYTTPDADGIIRVACGADIIEIHVLTPGVVIPTKIPAPPEPPEGSPPPVSTGSLPVGIKIPDIPIMTFKVKGSQYSKPDIDSLICTIQNKKSNKSEHFVVNMDKSMALDVHDIARFYAAIGENVPGAGVSFNFGGTFKK